MLVGTASVDPLVMTGLLIELNLFSKLSSACHPPSETHEHMNLTLGMNPYLMHFFRQRNCLFSTTTPNRIDTPLNELGTAEIPVPLLLLYLVSLSLGAPEFRSNEIFLLDHSHLLG